MRNSHTTPTFVQLIRWLSASLLLMVCLGCTKPTTTPGGSTVRTGTLNVVCTTGQIADAVRQIGGQHVSVTGLMGPGVDPHLYQATLADIGALKGADAIFFNGMHLEGRMADALVKMARKLPTFAVTEKLQDASDERLRQPADFDGHYDPHLWHNTELWSECIRFIADQLIELDSKNSAAYQANRDAYLQELQTLHKDISTQIAAIPADRRVMVTAHDAFGYFGVAYGIEVFGLKGVSTEDEATIQRTVEIVDMLVKRKIPAVFVESAVAPRVVEALVQPCRDQGHDVTVGGELYADALGASGSGADTYVGMMRANLKTITTALQAAP